MVEKHIEVAATQIMDDPVTEGRETGEKIPIPDTGRLLGAEYPITTLHMQAPLVGRKK